MMHLIGIRGAVLALLGGRVVGKEKPSVEGTNTDLESQGQELVGLKID